MTEAVRPGLVWSQAHVRAALLATVVGSLLTTWGWIDASGQADVADQIGPLALGVLGSIVVAVGAGAWAVAGRHALNARRLDVFGRLELELLPASAGSGAHTPESPLLVALAGSSRYHRAGCLLVQGKVDQATSTDPPQGRTPCEMCCP